MTGKKPTVSVPSSKSQLHRLLVLAAAGEREVCIRYRGYSGDIAATVGCLRALGADIREAGDILSVRPVGEGTGSCVLPCGESGTTLRFLLPLCGVLGRDAELRREGRLPERPTEPLVSELCAHGMYIESRGTSLFCSGQLRSGDYSLPGSISSQFISALLLALPLLPGDSTLTVTGKTESAGYIRMTESAMKKASLRFEERGRSYILPGGQRPALPEVVTAEGDFSSAAFFLAAGALTDGGVTVRGLDRASVQGDRTIEGLLRSFGAGTRWEGDALTVFPGALHGIGIDASQIPDLVPVLAVLGAAAEGETAIRRAARLRYKESDRLAAVASLLQTLGADVTELPDGLLIRGGRPLHGGSVSAFSDHRIAMAAAVASLLCEEEVRIDDPDCVKKSFPDFWKSWNTIYNA